MVRHLTRFIVALSLLFVSAPGLARQIAAQETHYEIAAIDNLSGSPIGFSLPHGINAGGDVAADSRGGAPASVAMLYRKGDVEAVSAEGEYASARALTKGRTIVGSTYSTDGIAQATTWKKGEKTILPALGEGGAEALGVNDQGLVVGRSVVIDGTTQSWHACSWKNGKITDLVGLGGDAVALDVNKAGQIVGASATEAGSSSPDADNFPNPGIHAVLWSDGEPTDLGVLPGGDASIAIAINDAGQVVGYSSVASEDPATTVYHAFLWDKGVMTDLGTFEGGQSSRAFSINNSGDIVGEATNPSSSQPGVDNTIAVLWKAGEIADLSDLISDASWTALISATAINDKGQITGQGYLTNYSGFLLTPGDA